MSKPLGRTILLAEDDDAVRMVLSHALTLEGYDVRATPSAQALQRWALEGLGDAIVTDVLLGEERVFDALPKIRAARPDLPILVISAQNTITTAMQAEAAGAFDYLPKPFDLDAVLANVARALDARGKARPSPAAPPNPMSGRSAPMQALFKQMARAAAFPAPVWIHGERGTGKDLIARTIHANSKMRESGLVRTSLLGLDRSGMRQALQERAARAGAVVFSEIDEASPEAQAYLMAFLREADFSEGRRLFAMSAHAPQADVIAGRVRPDLVDRLAVLAMEAPPLRVRKDDIAETASALLFRMTTEGLPAKRLDADAAIALQRWEWPGNVRELDGFLRRLAISIPGTAIRAQDVEDGLQTVREPIANVAAAPNSEALNWNAALRAKIRASLEQAGPDGAHAGLMSEIEAVLIRAALDRVRNNQIRAAKLLGLNRNTLRKKIQALKLDLGF